MAAFYNNEEQTLYVKRDVGDSVAVAQCVAQELGHAQLSINSDSYSRADMGFQAVCIGYMLCKKYGVDTQNLLSIVFLKSSSAKSRRTFAMSFPKREMQWRIFIPVFPMSFTRKAGTKQRLRKIR